MGRSTHRTGYRDVSFMKCSGYRSLTVDHDSISPCEGCSIISKQSGGCGSVPWHWRWVLFWACTDEPRYKLMVRPQNPTYLSNNIWLISCNFVSHKAIHLSNHPLIGHPYIET